MRKFLLFSVMFLSGTQMFSYTINHASKVYGMIGSGTELFMGGIGGSYASEIKLNPGDRFMQTVTVDAQFMGILSPSAFEFNFAGTYGMGLQFDNGNKLTVDILGLGFNLRSGGYEEFGNVIAYIPPSAFMLTLPGVQGTLANGFYVAWRNNWSIGNFGEYKTYIALGFDFSKIYNPKAFEGRNGF